MIEDFATAEVVTVPVHAGVIEAATLMQRQAVGCLVVVDAEGTAVGIVTDRDLAVSVVARECDAGALKVDDVMARELVTAAPEEAHRAVVERMQRRGVRRVPVLRDGKPVGIVSLDDLLGLYVDELADLSRGARDRFSAARRQAAVDRAREGAEELLDELRRRVSHAGADARDALFSKLDDLRRHLPGATRRD